MTALKLHVDASRLRWACVVGGLVAACLLSWQVLASEHQPLSLDMSVPPTCDVEPDADPVTPTLSIDWMVRGGAAPYRVFVHGEYREQSEGSDLVLCGIWAEGEVQSGEIPIVGTVSDANGDSASTLIYVQAVKNIRSDPPSGFRRLPLTSGQTYSVHGVVLTIPRGVVMDLGTYVSHHCRPEDAACGDEFPLYHHGSTLWLRRWHHDESRRIIGEGSDADAINEVFDQVVASIGRGPMFDRDDTGFSQADSPDIEITLQAPMICETHWGSYGGRRQFIQVEWQISGGRAPYRLRFGDHGMQSGDFQDHEGVITIPCGKLRDDADGVDSQVMNTQAIVVDADGAAASGVVSTYVISAGRHGGDLLRGGWTHRMEGLLVTIPDGLEFDVETISVAEVECPEDPTPTVCESSWSMSTVGGSVAVGIGYTTRQVIYRRMTVGRLATDPGVTFSSPANVEAALDELAASVGEPPRLPEWGVFNSAPLRIWAWPEPIVCGSAVDEWDQMRLARAQRRVGGGAWWPLGIGDEAWNPDHRSVQLKCGPEVGWHENTLEVHEGGPDGPMVETTVRHFAYPIFGDVDAFWVEGDGFNLSYCEPGGPCHDQVDRERRSCTVWRARQRRRDGDESL